MWPFKKVEEPVAQSFEWTIDQKTCIFTVNINNKITVMPTSSILGISSLPNGGLEVVNLKEDLSFYVTKKYKHIDFLKTELIKAMETK